MPYLAGAKFAQHCAYLVNAELIDTKPFFSACCTAAGVFLVHFMPNILWNEFQTFKKPQAQENQKMREHIKNGKTIALYPEGGIIRYRPRIKGTFREDGYPCFGTGIDHSEITKVLPFRWGGMQIALENRCDIYALNVIGTQVVWPMDSSLPGLPGTIHVSARKIGIDYDQEGLDKKKLAFMCEKAVTQLLSVMWKKYPEKQKVEGKKQTNKILQNRCNVFFFFFSKPTIFANFLIR